MLGHVLPLSTYPRPPQILVAVSPLYQGVAVERALFTGHLHAGLLGHLTYLAAMTLIFSRIAPSASTTASSPEVLRSATAELRRGRGCMQESSETEFRSLDGTLLRGTFVTPARPTAGLVLVHGGGVTRDEGGFFTRVAGGVGDAGVASLRFDFRGHGTSGGRQEDLTLSGVANDIRSAVGHLRASTGVDAVSVLGASFGGGITAMFAARHPEQVRCVVLINPLFDYKGRLIDEKPYWSDDRIGPDAAGELRRDGFVAHSPSFMLGVPLLNELFWVRPAEEIRELRLPTLILHGTGDTFVPIDSSREHIRRIPGETQLVEIEGAQHGIAVPDDPEYQDPQTQFWQTQAITTIANWITHWG